LGSFKKDEWLARQIGIPVYQIKPSPKIKIPSGPCFCFAKIPVEDHKTAQAFEAAGFAQIEIARTYCKKSKQAAADIRIREAKESDCFPLQEIASRAFQQSRFHLDQNFRPETAAAIKRAWVENYFMGKRGDRMVVVTEGGQSVGFMLLVEKKNKTLVDLIAVDPEFQGRGLGRALLAEASSKKGIVFAGTQKANSKACYLYETNGFVISKEEFVYHLHQ